MVPANLVLPNEVWKKVVGFEDYYLVSSLGRIYSNLRMPKISGVGHRSLGGKIMNAEVAHNGYLRVRLQANGISKKEAVHRVVMASFVGPIGDFQTVNHINGIKTDNRLENLEYLTMSENNAHAFRIGLRSNNEPRPYNGLTDDQAVELLKLRSEGVKFADLAQLFNVSITTVSRITQDKGYKWLDRSTVRPFSNKEITGKVERNLIWFERYLVNNTTVRQIAKEGSLRFDSVGKMLSSFTLRLYKDYYKDTAPFETLDQTKNHKDLMLALIERKRKELGIIVPSSDIPA